MKTAHDLTIELTDIYNAKSHINVAEIENLKGQIKGLKEAIKILK